MHIWSRLKRFFRWLLRRKEKEEEYRCIYVHNFHPTIDYFEKQEDAYNISKD